MSIYQSTLIVQYTMTKRNFVSILDVDSPVLSRVHVIESTVKLRPEHSGTRLSDQFSRV